MQEVLFEIDLLRAVTAALKNVAVTKRRKEKN